MSVRNIRFTLALVFASLLFAITRVVPAVPPGITPVAQVPKEERQFENTTPKHVPIRVRVKRQKEQSFKDLKNDEWLRELEIEVTNTGTKPIYFLALVMTVPDVKGRTGAAMAHDLLYGRPSLISITEAMRPSDIPIGPGETYVFTMPERDVREWTGVIREHNLPQPKRVQIVFQFINFGDGTGYAGGTAEPVPSPKKANDLESPTKPS